jgi:hypothetical protein
MSDVMVMATVVRTQTLLFADTTTSLEQMRI